MIWIYVIIYDIYTPLAGDDHTKCVVFNINRKKKWIFINEYPKNINYSNLSGSKSEIK